MKNSTSENKMAELTSHDHSFFDHLAELRKRLLYSVIFLIVIFCVLFYFKNNLYFYISQPLLSLLDNHESLIATEVGSPFLIPVKLSFFLALFFSAPFIILQIWQFVAPGLYSREKKIALPLLGSSILLFYLGGAFCYFVVLPLLLKFFVTSAPDNVAIMTDIGHYLSFIINFLIVFALAFQIPVIIFLLIHINVISPKQLSEKRPYIIVGCFIVGMLLTPADVFSQSFLAIPMWFLFEAGLLVGQLTKKQK